MDSKRRSERSSTLSDIQLPVAEQEKLLGADEPPDGGLTAWLQVLGVHITTFNTWGYVNSYGVFQTYYVETLGASPSAISWVGSVQIFLLFFLGAFTGRGLDAGYFRHLFAAGTILLTLGVLMTSIAKTYWQLLLSQGVCIGVANGLLFCPCLGLISTYFDKRKGLALGLAVVGSATGGMVLPAVVKGLLPRIGFAWTVRAMGLITGVTMACANLMVRPRLAPRKAGSIVEWEAFREPEYVLFTAGIFLMFLALYFAFFYVSSYSRDILHLDQETSFSNLIIMNAVGTLGRVLPNYLADHPRVGPMNLLIPMSSVVGILFLTWICVSSYGGTVTWVCLYGFLAAGIQSLFHATLGSLTKDLSKVGTRMGMAYSIVSFASLTGTPIGGALITDQDGGYWSAQVFAGTVTLVGCFFVVGSRIVKTGWKLNARA